MFTLKKGAAYAHFVHGNAGIGANLPFGNI